MAVYWNKTCLIGYLADTPQMDITPNTKTTVARFMLSVKNKIKDKKNIAIPISCFGFLADNVRIYATKGSNVLVEGQLNQYSRLIGKKSYPTYNVIAEKVLFISTRALTPLAPLGSDNDNDGNNAYSCYSNDDDNIESPF